MGVREGAERGDEAAHLHANFSSEEVAANWRFWWQGRSGVAGQQTAGIGNARSDDGFWL